MSFFLKKNKRTNKIIKTPDKSTSESSETRCFFSGAFQEELQSRLNFLPGQCSGQPEGSATSPHSETAATRMSANMDKYDKCNLIGARPLPSPRPRLTQQQEIPSKNRRGDGTCPNLRTGLSCRGIHLARIGKQPSTRASSLSESAGPSFGFLHGTAS